MRYFALGPDGDRFGPADLATLDAWTVEGRIDARTVLEEEGTGRRVPATSVAGLRFAPPIPDAGPPGFDGTGFHGAGAYARPGTTSYGGPPRMDPLATGYKPRNPNANFWGAIAMSALSLVLALAIGYVGFLLSVGSVALAWRARVDDRHPLSSLAIGITVIAAILSVAIRIWREFH